MRSGNMNEIILKKTTNKRATTTTKNVRKSGNTPKTSWCQKSFSSSFPLKTTQGETKVLWPPQHSLSPHRLIWVLKVIYSNIRGEASKVHLADKDAIADRNVVPGARLPLCILLSRTDTWTVSSLHLLHSLPVGSLSSSPLQTAFFLPSFIFPPPTPCLSPSLPHHAPLLLSVLTSAYTSPSLFPPYQLLLISLVPPSF